jgi:protein TonB
MGRSSVIDLLGPYVEAPPCDVALREGGVPANGPTTSHDLRLETGIVSRSPLVLRRRSCTGACSVVLHSAGLVAAVAVPLVLSSALPEPAGTVHAFLVEPLSIPPPPPPPPSASPTVAGRVPAETAPVPTSDLVAPIEVPDELTVEEGLDLGIAGGVAGGVEGGVTGAIVGGLPDSVTGTPPPVRPIRAGAGLVHEPTRIKYVAPVYPVVAMAANVEASVTLEASIDERGRVVDVTVLEGNALFDESALEAVRQWAYSPTLVDGVPVPILMTVTVHYRLAPGQASRGY